MNETELVNLTLSGCADAPRRIVELYEEPLYSFLYRYIGHAAEAEDLCQETFVLAFRNLGRFRGKSRLGTWLFAIGANLARSWHRREGKRRRARMSPEEAGLAERPDPRTACSSMTAVANERAEAVRRAIDSLPPREKTVVLLRTYHDLSYDEIARVLGCSQRAVGPLLCRARKRLAGSLNGLLE